MAYYLRKKGTNLIYVRTKALAERELVRICEEDGMCAARRWWVYQGVRNFGTALPSNEPLVYSAP